MTVALILVSIAIVAGIVAVYRRVTRNDGQYGPTAVH